MAKVYQCFLITPFGDALSDSAGNRQLAEDVDRLYEKILKPAEARCFELSYPVSIQDGRHQKESGSIFKKIGRALEDFDVVIAVLAWNRPNVFLELGMAYGSWRKPVLLAEKSFDRPSDINNEEFEVFSVAQLRDPAADLSAVVDGLAARIVRSIKIGRFVAPDDPETILASGLLRVYGRFSKGVTPGEWSKIINQAESEIMVAVPKAARINEQHFELFLPQEGYSTDTTLQNLLLARALQGVKVTVLMNHEENYSEDHLKQLAPLEKLPDHRDAIAKAWRSWSTVWLSYVIAARSKSGGGVLDENNFRVIQIKRRYLPYRITLTEKRALITLRFYTERFNSGPCIDATPLPADQRNANDERPIYDQVRNELNFLISENEDSSVERFEVENDIQLRKKG